MVSYCNPMLITNISHWWKCFSARIISRLLWITLSSKWK